MTGRRTVPFLAAGVAAGLLGGCGGKSSLPSVTISSGGQSTKSEAVSWLAGDTLKQASPALRELTVRPGATVQVAPAADVIARGWQISLDNKVLVPKTSKATASFTVPTNLGTRQPLVTVLAAPVGSSNRASGLWVFRLVPA